MIRALALLSVWLLVCGCSWNGGEPTANVPPAQPAGANENAALAAPKKLSSRHLPNPVRVHAKVISGGLPAGDAAFEELRDLGVKTIISVDGAKPDVATATKHGLRYVHLPHGYDGISPQRVQELAKAVRDLEGPIYIHCHHGKHRSPAAASVACVAAGMLPASDAVTVLKLAGTSPSYRGLYRVAEQTQPLDDALLDQLSADFRESVEIPPMAEAMVALEHTHDHVREIAAAGWRTPPAHPDLDAAHEALLLREHFTELLRAEYVQREPAEFRELLRSSERAAQELEDGLRAWQSAGDQSQPPDSLGRSLDRITVTCKACHEEYRDVPLGEK